MMAMTDKWRQPRQRWAEYFRKWVDTPEPMALMLTCVFFDLRAVATASIELLDGPAPRRAGTHARATACSWRTWWAMR
jgi:hypothetical protein